MTIWLPRCHSSACSLVSVSKTEHPVQRRLIKIGMTTQATQPHHPILGRLTRTFNPLVLLFAGRVPPYVVLEHRGRKSGRLHRSPVVAVRIRTGFLIPLAFGYGAQWVKNLRHAGRADLLWRGRRFEIANPEIIGLADGKRVLSGPERLFVHIFSPQAFLRVTASTHPHPSTPALNANTDLA